MSLQDDKKTKGKALRNITFVYLGDGQRKE